jgi:predicted ATP-dependent protease
LKQNIAVTGSVNQNGEIQAIGGINRKIEGFYDVCRLKGLTGDQGVLMPTSNLRNLMLRADVVKAVEEEKFHIYAVQSIDEGIEVLTGVAAGTRTTAGKFPAGSINALVEEKLMHFAERQRQINAAGVRHDPSLATET